MDKKEWIKVVKVIQKAGGFPIPTKDTIIELTQALMNEEEAKFLLNFKKVSQNLNQLMEISGLDEETIERILNQLMDKGVVYGTRSKSTGMKIFYVLPFLPGIFEFTFMKGEFTEREKKLAHLFDKLHHELAENTQNNYDMFVNQYKESGIMDRVVPVEKEFDVQAENVMHIEDIRKLIEQFDKISVSHCYCRHQQDLLDRHCAIDAPKENCIHIGDTATYTVEHGFGRYVSKDEVMKILGEAEDAGLVHKVIHAKADPRNPETSICNCCKCCCNMFNLYYDGIAPLSSLTSYVAKVDADTCIGCGTCVERCPVEAPELEDAIAKIDENRCIGCGVCAHHCPEEAISLERIGPKVVFIPPPRIKQN